MKHKTRFGHIEEIDDTNECHELMQQFAGFTTYAYDWYFLCNLSRVDAKNIELFYNYMEKECQYLRDELNDFFYSHRKKTNFSFVLACGNQDRHDTDTDVEVAELSKYIKSVEEWLILFASLKEKFESKYGK